MTTNSHHEISLQEAVDMTTLYRNNRPSNFFICETFERAAIDKLLATEGCYFVRIYLGMLPDLTVDAILVAANNDGEDILPAEPEPADKANSAIIIEDGFRCPEACPPPSPLNT